MELTAKHHRQVHNLLLFINIIGLTLLSIAIVVTYLNQPTKPCPLSFEPTTFEKETYFTNAPYIVEILDDEHDGRIECIGVLIKGNFVLTSRYCYEKVLDEVKKEPKMKPSVRHRDMKTGETVTITVRGQKYPTEYRPEFDMINDNLVLLQLNGEFKDVITVKLRDNYGDECNSLEKHNLTLVEYSPVWSQRVVTAVTQDECKAAWPRKKISDNVFCVVDKRKFIQFKANSFHKNINHAENHDPCKNILGGLLFETVTRPNSTVVEDVLVGVHSFHNAEKHKSESCDAGPTVFTNVVKYVSWINRNVN